MALIRYPGSKDKLADRIAADHFPDGAQYQLSPPVEYREPFFGAGAVGIRYLKNCRRHEKPVWFNDIDPGVASMWQAVHQEPDRLCARIAEFIPAAQTFYRYQEMDGESTGDYVEDGFRKLALHQISYSGLGYMAGGPLGGKFLANPKYNPGCRWRPERLKRDIRAIHRRMKYFPGLRITCGDFAPVIESAPPGSFVYIDPPYYEKGPQLYKHSMDDSAHIRLRDLLRASDAGWALSYDDHQFIRELYDWARISEVHVTYTTARARTARRPKNQEIVITPSNKQAAVA